MANASLLGKYEIIDNLTSTDTDKPLSAKQGKELKYLIDRAFKIVQIGGSGSTTINVNNQVICISARGGYTGIYYANVWGGGFIIDNSSHLTYTLNTSVTPAVLTIKNTNTSAVKITVIGY